MVPQRHMARVVDAHERFVAAISGLTDDDVRRPSLLPGWTVGHVLTHVARNADSHLRRADAAVRGQPIDQYAGGMEGRRAEIEAGAGRSAADLVQDVRRSADAVDSTWSRLPEQAWEGRTSDAGGLVRPLFELPGRRWQEVEVHLVDLDVGVSQRDWPDDFVVEWLPRTRERMGPAIPRESLLRRFEEPADELAWLYGRYRRGDLPTLPDWG